LCRCCPDLCGCRSELRCRSELLCGSLVLRQRLWPLLQVALLQVALPSSLPPLPAGRVCLRPLLQEIVLRQRLQRLQQLCRPELCRCRALVWLRWW
jgi:hypothetical protein